MTRSRTEQHYDRVPLPDARCPDDDCGNEDGNFRWEPTSRDIQPMPAEIATECAACGIRAHSLAFTRAYAWTRLGDHQRAQIRARQEQADDQYADYQASAHGLSSRRES